MSDPDIDIDDGEHVHSEPWPSEWLALQKAAEFAGKEADRIMGFIQKRGGSGFTPNMYCQIVNGNEERIMAVRRRFYDLRDSGQAMYHPDGLMICNSHGNPVKAWVPGKDPNAGRSKYQVLLAENTRLREQIKTLKQMLLNYDPQLKLI